LNDIETYDVAHVSTPDPYGAKLIRKGTSVKVQLIVSGMGSSVLDFTITPGLGVASFRASTDYAGGVITVDTNNLPPAGDADSWFENSKLIMRGYGLQGFNVFDERGVLLGTVDALAFKAGTGIWLGANSTNLYLKADSLDMTTNPNSGFYSIGGVLPDSNGNIDIVTSRSLKVTTTSGKVTISLNKGV
jgi:hypothetical protein